MLARYFEDLEIWQEARRLTREIYRLTAGPQFSKDFNLRGQIQRAAVSIMSNIAEGFERGGNQEFGQFLYVAKASCGKIRSQLYVAADLGYVSTKESVALVCAFKRLSSMIGSLINYLRRSGLKGAKYNNSDPSKNPKGLISTEVR